MASTEEIKSAYKKLVHRWHPDKTGCVDSEKYRLVCEAWYTLRDEHRRFLHNLELMEEHSKPIFSQSRIKI